jgi:hypothetical protein
MLQQARVEQVLSPPPPLDPLPLPDYLNCLCMVEQQTMALFDMLKAHNLLLEGGGSQEGAYGVPAFVGSEQALQETGTDGNGSSNSRKGQAAALRNYLDDQVQLLILGSSTASSTLYSVRSWRSIRSSC